MRAKRTVLSRKGSIASEAAGYHVSFSYHTLECQSVLSKCELCVGARRVETFHQSIFCPFLMMLRSPHLKLKANFTALLIHKPSCKKLPMPASKYYAPSWFRFHDRFNPLTNRLPEAEMESEVDSFRSRANPSTCQKPEFMAMPCKFQPQNSQLHCESLPGLPVPGADGPRCLRRGPALNRIVLADCFRLLTALGFCEIGGPA